MHILDKQTPKSSIVSLPNVILSIVNTSDRAYIEKKLIQLFQSVNLNEVEIQILKEINNNLFVEDLISISYLKEKFSYYFNKDIGTYLSKESVDSAIANLKFTQVKDRTAEQLLDLGSKLSTLTPIEIKQALAELRINDLMKTQIPPENALQKSENAYKEITERKEGLSLVLPEIEMHAGKAARGTIISILAFTGSFKSTFAINAAYINASNNFNVLYLALEDTKMNMKNRFVLNHIASTATTRSELIEATAIRDATLTEDQQAYYNKKHNEFVELMEKNLILWDSTDIDYQTFEDMNNVLRTADKEFKDKTGRGIDAIVLDQLALLKYTRGSGKKATYDGAIMNDWVTYFRTHSLNFLDEGGQIVVYMVSQVGREAYAEASKPKKKGRYDSSCASDSNEIERSSETMITLYKDLDTRNTLLINIPKARNGFVPDNPIQAEVYGEYFHVGPINIGNKLSAEAFNKSDFNLADLIKGK